MNQSKEWVDFMREQYPPGTRVVLREMKDPYNPVPPGTEGTITAIDDMCTVHVAWDTGSTLGLVPGEDRFSILKPQLETLKLYMPLEAQLYLYNGWGDLENDPVPASGREIAGNRLDIADIIKARQLPEEEARGLMTWYRAEDAVNRKVLSVRPEVELVDDTLMGVAVCTLQGVLTADERSLLCEYIEGQMSDGWGEMMEQQPIETDGGELYVSFWSYDTNWGLKTEAELNMDQSQRLSM